MTISVDLVLRIITYSCILTATAAVPLAITIYWYVHATTRAARLFISILGLGATFFSLALIGMLLDPRSAQYSMTYIFTVAVAVGMLFSAFGLIYALVNQLIGHPSLKIGAPPRRTEPARSFLERLREEDNVFIIWRDQPRERAKILLRGLLVMTIFGIIGYILVEVAARYISSPNLRP